MKISIGPLLQTKPLDGVGSSAKNSSRYKRDNVRFVEDLPSICSKGQAKGDIVLAEHGESRPDVITGIFPRSTPPRTSVEIIARPRTRERPGSDVAAG